MVLGRNTESKWRGAWCAAERLCEEELDGCWKWEGIFVVYFVCGSRDLRSSAVVSCNSSRTSSRQFLRPSCEARLWRNATHLWHRLQTSGLTFCIVGWGSPCCAAAAVHAEELMVLQMSMMLPVLAFVRHVLWLEYSIDTGIITSEREFSMLVFGSGTIHTSQSSHSASLSGICWNRQIPRWFGYIRFSWFGEMYCKTLKCQTGCQVNWPSPAVSRRIPDVRLSCFLRCIDLKYTLLCWSEVLANWSLDQLCLFTMHLLSGCHCQLYLLEKKCCSPSNIIVPCSRQQERTKSFWENMNLVAVLCSV